MWWEVDTGSVSQSGGAAAVRTANPAGPTLVYTFPPGTHTVTVVDTTPPVVQILSPDGQRVYSSIDRVEVTWSVHDNHDLSPSVEVKPGNPAGPPLEPGTMTVRVEATDASGNTGSAEVAVRVVALAAEVTIQPQVLNLSSGDGDLTVHVRLPEDPEPGLEVDLTAVSLIGPLGSAVPVSGQAVGPGKASGKGKGAGKGGGPHDYAFTFNRAAVAGIVEAPACSLRLAGKLLPTSPFGVAAFEGGDLVYVKVPGQPGPKGHKAIALSQNVPNPFNPSTQIGYELYESSDVTLVVYNVLGQSIRVPARGIQPAGTYRVQWNGLDDRGRPVDGKLSLPAIDRQPGGNQTDASGPVTPFRG